MHGTIGKKLFAPFLGDLVTQHGSHGSIRVLDRERRPNPLAVTDRTLCDLDEPVVERLVETVVLLFRAVNVRDGVLLLCFRQYWREIDALRLPVNNGIGCVEHVDAADHLLERAEAEQSHDTTRLLGNHEKVIDDVLGLARELIAKLGILRGDADWAGVEMALSHHDAAHRDEGRSAHADFLGAEQRSDHDVAAGLYLSIRLKNDSASEVVHDQRLMRLRDTELPWKPGVLDRRER